MAIICREQKLSYSQLNKRINILAHELVKKGIKAGDFVAIITERSIEMMIGIYAVLKAGGAYIPIEQNRCAMACQGCGAVFTFL